MRYATTALVGLAVIFLLSAPAQSAVWQLTGDGNWNTPGNWDSSVPNAQDAVADFTQKAISGNPSTVTLDVNATVGELAFGRTSSNWVSMVLASAAGETLTLDNSGGTTAITVNDGTGNLNYGVRIESVLTGDDDVSIAVYGGDTNNWWGLTLNGANTWTGDTYLVAGTVRLNNDTVGVGAAVTSGPLGTGVVHMQDGSRIGSYGDRTLGNALTISGSVEVGTGNNNVTFTGPVTLLGDSSVDQSGGYMRIAFDGAVGESGGPRSLSLSADTTSDDGDYNSGFTRADRNIWLNGDNTFTGGLTILAGRVELNGDNSAATGDVTVQAGAILELRNDDAISDLSSVWLEEDGGSFGRLDMEATVTVAELYLDGVAQGAGTYNSTTHPDYFIDGGDLIVVPVPEPATLALLGLGGLATAGGAVRRRRR